MSFFLKLIETTDDERRALEAVPKIRAMINHGLTPDEYRAFLHDLYHIVWHFCPIMASAASRLGDDFRQVRYQLYHNIEEEQGPRGLGCSKTSSPPVAISAAAHAVPPSAPVQAMIAFNYYTTERVHPCGVLGHALRARGHLLGLWRVYGGARRVSDLTLDRAPGAVRIPLPQLARVDGSRPHGQSQGPGQNHRRPRRARRHHQRHAHQFLAVRPVVQSTRVFRRRSKWHPEARPPGRYRLPCGASATARYGPSS